jgi:hypothetical protein
MNGYPTTITGVWSAVVFLVAGQVVVDRSVGLEWIIGGIIATMALIWRVAQDRKGVDARFDMIDVRLDYLDSRLKRLEVKINSLCAKAGSLGGPDPNPARDE